MTDRADFEDDFAPLTPQELVVQGPETVWPDKADLTLVAPIPLGAKRVTFWHGNHGDAQSTFCYRNEDGAPMGYTARFDFPDGTKEGLPRTLWQDESGQSWRWRQWPEPRPLYGLDRLAHDPSAPLVVVEGEKCADAAVAVFPRSAVITSPGGSKVARKADWSPLKGRRVLIWPISLKNSS